MESEYEVPAEPQARKSCFIGGNEKLDKENLHCPVIPNRQTAPTLQQNRHQQLPQQHGQSEHTEKPQWVSMSSPSGSKGNPSTPSSAPANFTNKTPKLMTPHSYSSLLSEPRSSVYSRRTPMGSSKLLRDHFGRLSMLGSADASNTDLSDKSNSSSQRRRRMLDSGAVRLLASGAVTSQSPGPVSPISSSPVSSRRIGFDGTMATPSRELLRSTTSSRNQRAVAPVTFDPLSPNSTKENNIIAMEEDNSSTDRTISSSDHNSAYATANASLRHGYNQYNGNGDVTISIPVVLAAAAASSRAGNGYVSRRLDCGDPVAWTLWKGGEEDLPWLLEQDRSLVPKVSSNLSDVYGETTTADMARPVPIMASRRFV